MLHLCSHSLDALDPNAYAAFQVSHDLKGVVKRVLSKGEEVGGAKPGMTKGLSIRVSLMTPVKPMLVSGWSLLTVKIHCICNLMCIFRLRRVDRLP